MRSTGGASEGLASVKGWQGADKQQFDGRNRVRVRCLLYNSLARAWWSGEVTLPVESERDKSSGALKSDSSVGEQL
jgi:hypothetical protein